MPVPTSYTEAEFADYLQRAMGGLSGVLEWTSDRQSFDEVIIDTLNAMEVVNVEDVPESEIPKLRALGKVYLWKSISVEMSADYDFSADGASYSRSQVFEHAQRMLSQAEIDAADWLITSKVGVAKATYHRDPYADHDDYLTDHIDQYLDELRS